MQKDRIKQNTLAQIIINNNKIFQIYFKNELNILVPHNKNSLPLAIKYVTKNSFKYNELMYYKLQIQHNSF